jgi:hypothetical protein
MLDQLKALFKEGLEYTHTAGLLQQIANLTNIVHEQYMKDENGKNTAIDTICEILQTHKTKPVVAEAPKEVSNAVS